MLFKNEAEFEIYIRNLIINNITTSDKNIYLLDNKKIVDIVICRDHPIPALFFIEVKYYKKSHNRLSIGNSDGKGFQIEILKKNPLYFQTHLKWVLASEEHYTKGVIFVTSEVIKKYISGKGIDEKQNNIQLKIFQNENWLTENQFIVELQQWMMEGI